MYRSGKFDDREHRLAEPLAPTNGDAEVGLDVQQLLILIVQRAFGAKAAELEGELGRFHHPRFDGVS